MELVALVELLDEAPEEAMKAADWVTSACPQSVQYVPEGTLARAWLAGVMLPERIEVT